MKKVKYEGPLIETAYEKNDFIRLNNGKHIAWGREKSDGLEKYIQDFNTIH